MQNLSLGKTWGQVVQEHIYLAQVLRSVELNQAVKKKKGLNCVSGFRNPRRKLRTLPSRRAGAKGGNLTRGLLSRRVGEHEHGFMLAVEKLHGWQVGLFAVSWRTTGAGRIRQGEWCSGAEKGEQGRAYSCTVMSFQA